MGSLKTFLCVLLFLLQYSLMILGYGPLNLSLLCKNTPYPKQCEYYLSKISNFPVDGNFDFLETTVQSAMQNAENALLDASAALETKSVDGSVENGAWSDCPELYDLAIQHMNRTVNTPNCTSMDKQTWLSSALTHFQTCLDGFTYDSSHDTQESTMVSSHVNVSYLISNALAINNDGGTGPEEDSASPNKDGFPSWLKPGDRKLLQSTSAYSEAKIVVAKDGSGNCETIGEAIKVASKNLGGGRIVIYIKEGSYKENVDVGSGMKNIMFLGDGMGKTIITGSKSVGGGTTTFKSATVAVVGSRFIAQGITFQNVAGPSNHQAVALRSNSDLSVFYKCSFEGYQDTLYVFSNRQFYRECNIYGTVDFIFGNAAVVFQKCNIYARYPPHGTNTITAQGRTDPNQNTGISIQNCRVTSASNLNGVKTYLGRPWQKYSRTVFMETYLDSIVDPKGWLEWSGNFAISTLYYGEYSNTGPGSSTGNRVKWPGHHVITSATEAGKFTVGNFVAGKYWLPETGIPFTSGL